jgi:dienelactone hydrolase
MLTPLALMAMSTSTEIQTQKTNSEVNVVKIPSTSGRPIKGTIYGSGPNVVILSNMDPNELDSWAPIIPELVAQKKSVLSYAYNRIGTERVKDLLEVLDFVQSHGFLKVVLIGACRGGVITIQAAAINNSKSEIVAVAALAAPIQYEGTTFYSSEELSSISVPKLLINSEGDDSASDTRKIYEVFIEPKAISFYSGNEHGTDIFNNPDHKKVLIEQLANFVSSSF